MEGYFSFFSKIHLNVALTKERLDWWHLMFMDLSLIVLASASNGETSKSGRQKSLKVLKNNFFCDQLHLSRTVDLVPPPWVGFYFPLSEVNSWIFRPLSLPFSSSQTFSVKTCLNYKLAVKKKREIMCVSH